tara:strand:+ start:1196 stop:1390 length:195 start_codon:yes stop_codon:yes gene_type:complete
MNTLLFVIGGPELIILLIPGLITGFLGRYISKQKGRNPMEGFLLGFFFSLIGVIISLFLPNKNI